MLLDYRRIEQQLVEALPELRPVGDAYWQQEGVPGEDSGPYILFEDVFRPYVTLLLGASPSSVRDRLLRRAFDVIESMLAAGGEVANLAGIAVFEGQPSRWYELASGFLGRQSRAEIKQYGWASQFDGPLDPGVDLYGVSALVRTLLGEPVPDGAA